MVLGLCPHQCQKQTYALAFIVYIIVLYIYCSAGQRLIVINRIQNKSFCLYNICVCAVCIHCVFKKTHTYSIYFENIYMYLHVYVYIHIIYIIYKYI